MAGAMDGLEPNVEFGQTSDGRGGVRYLTVGEIIQLSQATSLKRIADTLAMLSTESCNCYGETLLPALTRAISDGVSGR